MGVYIFILVLFLIQFSNGDQNTTVACPFNTLCKCTTSAETNLAYFESLELFSEVHCNEVPFAKLPGIPSHNISKLSIVGSGLQVLEDDALGALKLASLNLARNNLVIISPRSMSNEIWSLKLNWENLRETLQSLFLGKNQISTVPLNIDYSLSNLQRVKKLDIDNNFIEYLEQNGLPYTLVSLSVKHNYLKDIPTALISSLRDLQKFYLSDNYIETLPSFDFNRRTLTALDLSENYIRTLSDILGRSLKIVELNFSYNKISAIKAKAFDGLACVHLDLSHNLLHSLPDKSFYGLSYTLESLDLSFNQLNKVPKALFGLSKLKSLSLRHNKISTVPDGFLKNSSSSLNYLTLSHNYLKTFPKYELRNLKHLSTLYLAYNQINYFGGANFALWGNNLKIFSLASNGIKALQSNSFKGANGISTLRLSYNNFYQISDKAFVNLNNLRTLDLGFALKNNTYPDQALKHLTNLRELYIDNNNIVKIPDAALYNFRLLTTLNLDFNKIEDIPVGIFRPNYHSFLTDVRLSFNKIVQLKSFTFAYLNGLKTVSLSYNQMSTIQSEAFKNLPAHLTVVLSHNNLMNLNRKTFVSVPNLVELDLSNNIINNFNWDLFLNVSSSNNPMTLNLSRNHVRNSEFENKYIMDSHWNMGLPIQVNIYVGILDLSHNDLEIVPFERLQAINKSLKDLNLSYNWIKQINNAPFKYMSKIEVLNLEHNQINDIKGAKFQDMPGLQILDLSHNHISSLLWDQFHSMTELRVLDLSHNDLSSLTAEFLKYTKVERLILNHNNFVTVPSQPLLSVGHTLIVLDLSNNKIQNIDPDQFTNTPLLTSLNLCNNRISNIHENMLRNLNSLINLQLCSNRFPPNLQDFYHNVSLHYLSFADSGLHDIPFLVQSNLVSLNLSKNMISHLKAGFLFGIPNLRKLDLSKNNLSLLSNPRWNEAAQIIELDISRNPIEVLTKESFYGLDNLKYLNLQHLTNLKRFDFDALSATRLLQSIKLQTWPNIEKYRFRLPRVLSRLKYLQKVFFVITETRLSDQLIGAFPQKLKYLEISGENLGELNSDALTSIIPSKEMILRITDTNITSFPQRFFSVLSGMKVTLDLRNNNIKVIGPENFYKDHTAIKSLGTQDFSGGLHLAGNNLECNCETAWIGYWLKRHLRETLSIQTKSLKYSKDLIENLYQIHCTHPQDGLIKLLTYETTNCYTSGSLPNYNTNMSFLFLLSFNFFVIFIFY